MATASNADSESHSNADSGFRSNAGSESHSNADSESRSDGSANGTADSASLADRLETAATIIWVVFLAVVVVFTLIPVVGVWAGVAPFDPPPATPYFALVGLALLGTVALVAAGIYDV